MEELGFVKGLDEGDGDFNLRALSSTFSLTARALFEEHCSKCTYADKFECLINPKCVIHSRVRRLSDNGDDFIWKVEAWLERENRKNVLEAFFEDSNTI